MKSTISYAIALLLGLAIPYFFAKWIFSLSSMQENPLSIVYIFIVFLVSTGVCVGAASVIAGRK